MAGMKETPLLWAQKCECWTNNWRKVFYVQWIRVQHVHQGDKEKYHQMVMCPTKIMF